MIFISNWFWAFRICLLALLHSPNNPKSAPTWKKKLSSPMMLPMPYIPLGTKQNLDPRTRNDLRRGDNTKACSILLWFSPWKTQDSSCKFLLLLLTVLPSCHVCPASSPWMKNNSKRLKPTWHIMSGTERKYPLLPMHLHMTGLSFFWAWGLALVQKERKWDEKYWTKFIRFLVEEIQSCFVAYFNLISSPQSIGVRKAVFI